MAGGDHQRAIEAGPRAGDAHEPAFIGPLDALDRGVELDAVEDTEVLRIVAHIGERFAMRGVGRILLGHRVILEARVFAGRDEIGGVVDDARARGLVPQSSDVVLPLEAVEGDAPLGECLGGRQSRRSRTDNADFVGFVFGVGRLHVHRSEILS